MSDELQTLIKQYKETQWDKLLRKDLGDHHLNEIKPDLDFIKKFFDLIIENYKKLDSEQKNDLQTMLSEFEQHKKRIEQHSKINSTQSIIDNIFIFKNEILNRFQHLIEIFKSLSKNNQNILSDELIKKIKQYNDIAKQIEENFQKVQQMQSQLADQTKRDEAERYGDFFKKEAESNNFSSRFYGSFLLLFTIGASWFAYYFLQFDPSIEARNSFDLIIKGNLINKIFIFTLILIVISILRRNFLALKHQYTLNRHRHNALSSHKEILSSIMGTESESDKEISNAILLELTKSMFTPQDTGFMQNQKNTSSENRIVEISKSLLNSPKE